MHCHQLAAQPDREFSEVDLGFPPGQVGLWNEHSRLAAAVPGADLRAPFGDVGADDRVGHVGHAMLRTKPIEYSGDCVMLLSWVQVCDEDSINHRLERIQLRRPWRVCRTLGWPGRIHCCFDGSRSDVVYCVECRAQTVHPAHRGELPHIARLVIDARPSRKMRCHWPVATGSRSRSPKTRLATKSALSAFGKPQ